MCKIILHDVYHFRIISYLAAMYEFVEGSVEEVSPTHVVVHSHGIGFFVHISLNTYEKIRGVKQLRIYTHLAVKEDSHSLFGFYDRKERMLFRELISVSGIGTATARMVLSSLSENEIIGAILNSNVALLKSIKGIGPKAAQRMILELQEKLGKVGVDYHTGEGGKTMQLNEATEALLALGFGRAAIEKVLLKVSKDLGEGSDTEDLIKKSLKLL